MYEDKGDKSLYENVAKDLLQQVGDSESQVDVEMVAVHIENLIIAIAHNDAELSGHLLNKLHYMVDNGDFAYLPEPGFGSKKTMV